MRCHIHQKQSHSVKLHIIVAGHFIEQAAFSVHHLIVAYRQNKVFRKSIEKAKGYAVVVAFSEKRIHGGVAKHIVHPAHVPFKVEAKPAYIRRHCYHRPSC